MKLACVFALVASVSASAFGAPANPWSNPDPKVRQDQINAANDKLSRDNYLKQWLQSVRPDVPLSDGVTTISPFAFDDGNGISIVGYADYDKVKKKFAEEDLVPEPMAIPGEKGTFAMVIIDVTRYSRTSAGPAYVARLSTPIVLSKNTVEHIENALEPSAKAALQGKVQYAPKVFYWKYWEGGVGIDIHTAGRKILNWPQEHGAFEKELKAIGFDLKHGFWKVSPYYQGVFLPDPVEKDKAPK